MQQYSGGELALNNRKNGYSNNSPNLSQHSGGDGETTLISRTQKQHTTQQVTTTTKTIREIQYLGPDGKPLDYVPDMGGGDPRLPPHNYEDINSSYPPEQMQGYPRGYDPYGYSPNYTPNYAEYPHRPPTPPSPSDRSASPPPQHRDPDYMRQVGGPAYPPRSGYDELDTTLMPPTGGMPPARTNDQYPGGRGSPSQFQPMPGSVEVMPSPYEHQQAAPANYADYGDPEMADGPGAPRAFFDEDEAGEPSPVRSRSSLGQGPKGVHWRDPDLPEVIEFLNNPNSVIKANAAAYLQHLCYMDDPVKAKTRQLGGIPPLVALLSNEIPEIHRNSCGALRNLSYGRQNDENKRAIKNAAGIPSLVRLLRKTNDNEVKELVTGVLWNLSSCDDLKRPIIDDALLVLVNIVIIPHSGWDPKGPGSDSHWTTVLRNSTGILRNVSSAGDYGRKKLRECEGLVDSIVYLLKNAIEKANIDNKSVENSVCVLRNLSYRSQEIEDPNYDKKQLPTGETRAAAGGKANSDNLGCFGGKAKRKDSPSPASTTHNSSSSRLGQRSGPVKGMDLLWQPEVVQPYLNLLSNCSNPETLEAAAGAIQNLAACYWQPSIDIRAAVRKEKGLPILVELLRMEVDRVVCAVATALRNLAIDQRNKELIGKYAMRDLVQKLPSGNPQHDHGTSDDTIAAVLATLNEVIKKHPEFSRSLLEAGGVDRLMNITRQRQRFSSRVVKFASQVLYSMWTHQELREVYKKAGWKEQDFVTKTIAARNARPNSPTNMNSTLNRPMASQSGTRYEDRTIRRGDGSHAGNNAAPAAAGVEYRSNEVPMENLSLYGAHHHVHPQAAQGGGRMYPPGNHLASRPGEPVYAQVNRDKKKNSRSQFEQYPGTYSDYGDDHWSVANQQGIIMDGSPNPNGGAAAGDSWV